METTVKLQEPFHYAIWPIIAVGGLVLAIILAIVLIILLKNRKPKAAKEKTESFQIKDLAKSKKKALTALDNILQDFMKDKITTRDSYQKTSDILRTFVYEVTGVKVTNLTLDEIRKIGLPALETLVCEYYPPEFQSLSKGDVNASINRTKKVIEEWK